MTKLLEIKDKMLDFYGNYETYLFSVVKFIIALLAFSTINSKLGYRESLTSVTVVLVLSLVCCLLPVNGTIFIAGIFILAHLSALSMESALVTALLFIVIYLIYFRFTPKDGIIAILTPIAFNINIPFVMPIACGLMRPSQSVIGVACGTIFYYFLDGISKSAVELAELTTDDGTSSKINLALAQLFANKEMYVVLAVMIVACIAVNVIRKVRVDYAWTIAIISGVLIQVIGVVVGLMVSQISINAVMITMGSLASLIVGFVLQFLFMNLDYSRTERLQFEDDDYFYFVKAVPKKTVAGGEKAVKHFGNTMSMGKRINKENKNLVDDATTDRVIAQELDFDDDLLK